MIKRLTAVTARILFIHLVGEFQTNLHVIAKAKHRSDQFVSISKQPKIC